MGQKVHPGGMRVGVIHDWKSNWYTSTKEFPEYLLEDIKIREHIYGKLAHAGLSDILIRKDKQRITIDIYTARPGIRSEEHTSELQSLAYLVCRLLLEKKKKTHAKKLVLESKELRLTNS